MRAELNALVLGSVEAEHLANLTPPGDLCHRVALLPGNIDRLVDTLQCVFSRYLQSRNVSILAGSKLGNDVSVPQQPVRGHPCARTPIPGPDGGRSAVAVDQILGHKAVLFPRKLRHALFSST